MELAVDLQNIERLANDAKHIADENDASRQAFEAAQCELLQALFAKISRTTMLAISTRPKIATRVWWVNVSTDAEVSRASWRGLLIAGNSTPIRRATEQNAGRFEGRGLYVTPGRELVELVYSGSWSDWQGSTTEWEAQERWLNLQTAVGLWQDLPTSASQVIAGALERYVDGKASVRANLTRARAEQLRALTSLLK